jgi:DNA-binding transcriptional ArsR family regulator
LRRKHLKVLEEAGAIVRAIDGRTHRLRLNGESLEDAYAWLARQRALWERKLDVVEAVGNGGGVEVYETIEVM